MLGLNSCVESSKKYKALEAERDSLQVVASNVTTDFESSLRTINEIEMALQNIREAENIILMENQEGNTNYAASQIEAIDRSIQQNKAKIADLEKQLADAGSKSKQLNATITRLKTELNEKDTYITNLREELNISQAQVAELTDSVVNLNQNVKNLNENIHSLNTQNAEQQAMISMQDAELNTVYYIVAPKETLVANDLVSKGGLFSSDNVTGEVKKSVMIAADKRTLKVIPLNTKKATIMTNHPESSYQLTKGDDKMLSLEIADPEAFWKISNYLIISIK
jgi:chromosome segregation ATPase